MSQAKVRISELRVLNYKSFRDSGWLTLGENFTVIVGQNNSGKTALIQSLRLNDAQHHPHRGPAVRQYAGQNPKSRFQLRLMASGAFLKAALIRHQRQTFFTMPSGPIGQRERFLEEVFARNFIEFELEFSAGSGGCKPLKEPSHQLCDVSEPSFLIEVNDDQSDIIVHDASSGDENLYDIFNKARGDFRYVFDPERLRIGLCAIQDTEILEAGAQNLPAVLAKLNRNPSKWATYNEHVRQVFPSIREVTVSTVGIELAVFVWSNDPHEAKDDEAFLLQESGTGIGQVLAILYVAMTASGSVIAIDEPNSFLHPGAAKKLMTILKEYRQNQYIVSTHSPELLNVIDAEVLLLVSWKDGESKVEQLERRSIDSMKRVLDDVGCELGDVFIADKVIWVEGPTEAKCFPLLIDGSNISNVGTLFRPLRATGDLESKKADTALILDIYTSLSQGPSILSRSTAFNLDREGRSETDIRKMEERSGGRIQFLPLATYENYLLDPEAIAAVLDTEYRMYEADGVSPTAADVEQCLALHGSSFLPRPHSALALNDPKWLTLVNGSQLLGRMFAELTGNKFTYRKPHHSVSLTQWLITNKPDSLTALQAYVTNLVR